MFIWNLVVIRYQWWFKLSMRVLLKLFCICLGSPLSLNLRRLMLDLFSPFPFCLCDKTVYMSLVNNLKIWIGILAWSFFPFGCALKWVAYCERVYPIEYGPSFSNLKPCWSYAALLQTLLDKLMWYLFKSYFGLEIC